MEQDDLLEKKAADHLEKITLLSKIINLIIFSSCLALSGLSIALILNQGFSVVMKNVTTLVIVIVVIGLFLAMYVGRIYIKIRQDAIYIIRDQQNKSKKVAFIGDLIELDKEKE